MYSKVTPGIFGVIRCLCSRTRLAASCCSVCQTSGTCCFARWWRVLPRKDARSLCYNLIASKAWCGTPGQQGRMPSSHATRAAGSSGENLGSVNSKVFGQRARFWFSTWFEAHFRQKRMPLEAGHLLSIRSVRSRTTRLRGIAALVSTTGCNTKFSGAI